MSNSFCSKLIMSGKIFEVYDFENSVGGQKSTRTIYKKRKKEQIMTDLANDVNDIKGLAGFSVRRTKSKITRLVYSNSDLQTFMTLTFKDNLKDLRTANLIFKNFILRFKRLYPDLKYIAVPEFQKRGAVHYHLLCNYDVSSLISDKEIKDFEVAFATLVWRQGFIDLSTVKNIEKAAYYIAKYIGKDLFDLRYFGMRKILLSKNLKTSLIITGYNKVKKYIDFFLSGAKVVFESNYKSDWVGNINYKLYKLNYEN